MHHLPVMGGATQSLLGLVHHALKANLTCKVLFLRTKGNAIETYRTQGVEVLCVDNVYSYAHAYGAYNTFMSRRPWRVVTNLIKSIKSTNNVRSVIQKVNPRLVYLNTSVLIPFAIASKELKIPVIWHLREQIHSGNLGFRKKMVQVLFLKYASKIIAISEVNKKAIGLENIEVVYNSVDFKTFDRQIKTSEFRTQYKLDTFYTLCFIGGSVLSKGADLLVEAAERLLQNRSDFTIVVAGKFNRDSTSTMNRIEKKVDKILKSNPSLKKCFRFVGTLPNVAKLIASSDLLIWPATTPHFARPIMEAMVMGKAVIASNYLSSKEILEHEKQGLLVKPSVADLSDAMTTLLDQDAKRQNMGEAGYTKAIQLFNAGINNAKIMENITQLIR